VVLILLATFAGNVTRRFEEGMGVALYHTIFFRAYDIRGIVEIDLDEGIYEL